jgi:transketolase
MRTSWLVTTSIEARVAVEQATDIGWECYAGRRGAVVGMRAFGGSAPVKGLLTPSTASAAGAQSAIIFEEMSHATYFAAAR